MSKRTTGFERRSPDLYPTPFKAIPPLVPYLRAGGIKTFVEPCCGDGALIRHLQSFGLRCAYSGDIATGQDALALGHYGAADAIITNPPHARPAMHALIQHFAQIMPAWLLIDFDWLATKQASALLTHCSDAVIVPRLRWIEGSAHAGKDNFAWLRFDSKHGDGPILHNDRGCAPFRLALARPQAGELTVIDRDDTAAASSERPQPCLTM